MRMISKVKLYSALVFAAGFALALVSQLKISGNTMDFLRGMLIALAIVFLAAAARNSTKIVSRSEV